MFQYLIWWEYWACNICYTVPLINILFTFTKEVKWDGHISKIFHRKPLGEIISTKECFISHKLKEKCKASFRRFLLLHKGKDFNVTDVYYYWIINISNPTSDISSNRRTKLRSNNSCLSKLLHKCRIRGGINKV